jgi:Uncharacterized protein conserved in bacteria
MIGNKLTKWLICILILIDFLHALTRVILGHTGLDNIVLLVANILWITVYLSLYSYLPLLCPKPCVKQGLLVLLLVQILTVIIIYLEQFKIHWLYLCVIYSSFFLSGIQIVALLVVGIGLSINNPKTVLRYLSYALITQGVAIALIFVANRLFIILLRKASTMAMMANLFSVLLDNTEIFVLIYMFRVFEENYESYQPELFDKIDGGQ